MIAAVADSFARTLEAMSREPVESYDFHAGCWEELAHLLGGRS
jgi:hypothetical protein